MPHCRSKCKAASCGRRFRAMRSVGASGGCRPWSKRCFANATVGHLAGDLERLAGALARTRVRVGDGVLPSSRCRFWRTRRVLAGVWLGRNAFMLLERRRIPGVNHARQLLDGVLTAHFDHESTPVEKVDAWERRAAIPAGSDGTAGDPWVRINAALASGAQSASKD